MMPWGRCDDTFYRHQKVGLLSDDTRKGALALFWLAISWSNDQLTDGLVPAGTVRVLGGEPEEAEALVEVGLWERDGRHYRVHDFLRFNKSKAQIIAERAQRSAAGSAGAASRWHSDGDSPYESPNGTPHDTPNETNGGSDAPVPRTPYPVSVTPDSLAREGMLPHIDPDLASAIERLTGRSVLAGGAATLAELDRLAEDHGTVPVVAALEAVAHGQRMTLRQLVWPAMKTLEPFAAVPKPPEDHAHAFFGYPVARCKCGEERIA